MVTGATDINTDPCCGWAKNPYMSYVFSSGPDDTMTLSDGMGHPGLYDPSGSFIL